MIGKVQAGRLFPSPYDANGFQSVHDGHLHVYKHQVGSFARNGLNRLVAVFNDDYRIAMFFKKFSGKKPVDGIVFRNQDFAMRAFRSVCWHKNFVGAFQFCFCQSRQKRVEKLGRIDRFR